MGNSKSKTTSNNQRSSKKKVEIEDKNDTNDKQQEEKTDVDEKEFKSKLEKLTFIPHLILMGDSVLDNIAWVHDQDKRMDVEKQLNIALKQYNKSWKCKNLAVDGNTTQSLIRSFNYYNLEKTKQIQPKRFKSLQYYLESEAIDLVISKEKPIVVLSIGGNDVLGYMYHIKQLSKNVLNDMKVNEFMKNYQQILNILIDDCKCDVIIVFCYEPQIRFCKDHNVERKELLNIMQWASQQIFSIAEKYKLPLIDLSRTANPYNIKHYCYASPIEPNEMNGSFTTNLVIYVLSDFVWDMDKGRCSKIYYGQNDDGNGIKVEENTAKSRNNYLKNKIAIHPFRKIHKYLS